MRVVLQYVLQPYTAVLRLEGMLHEQTCTLAHVHTCTSARFLSQHKSATPIQVPGPTLLRVFALPWVWCIHGLVWLELL